MNKGTNKALILLAVLLVCDWSALPQDRGGSDALEWSRGLGERLRNLSNPVVSSYALGRLAGLVCGRDPIAGSALFRQALARVDGVPSSAFGANGPVLPVSSFTALWRSVNPAAIQCDPALGQRIDRQKIDARLAEDRQQAPERLRQAIEIVDPVAATADKNFDRAAQLADAAISSADPFDLDISALTLFLSHLRDDAPELADDLFPKAVDLVTSGFAPQTASLNELGKYLFVDPQLLEKADRDQVERSGRIGASVIEDFRATRLSANPDTVQYYLDALIRTFASTDNPNYDAVTAYAITYQALQTARELELDAAQTLENLITQIPVSSTDADRVLVFLKGGSTFDLDRDASRDGPVRRVLGAIREKHFDQARLMLTDIDDPDRRSQVGTLLIFGETAAAIAANDLPRAMLRANTLRPGVKRALLYAGIVAAAPADVALQELSLAMKDAEGLPAEYRVAIYSALAAALFHADPDRALTLINEVVRSLEDARTLPRRARVDPRGARTVRTVGAAASTDVPFIIVGDAKLFEVIDSGVARHNFPLQIPGLSAIQLPAVIRKSTGLDPARLEAALLRLRDETRLAAALIALAEVRLGQR